MRSGVMKSEKVARALFEEINMLILKQNLLLYIITERSSDGSDLNVNLIIARTLKPEV
jgi:hypothetical protein